MDRRIGLLATLVLAGTTNVAAGQTVQGIDCTILGELTRQHTFRRLDEYFGGSSNPLRPQITDYSRLQICNETAVSVTRGYAAAMAQFGMPVRWSAFDTGPGCAYGDIDQCFPFADPAAVPLPVDKTRLLATTWQEVRDVITAHMPWGTQSNLSYFSSASLLSAYGSAGPVQAGSISIEPAFSGSW